jgi:Protein of unknown function (DUF2442)
MQIILNLKLNGMNTLVNNFDAIEKIIFDEGLRIETIDFHPELDLMLIVLNSKAILQQKLSDFKQLQNANKKNLENYYLIANGLGIHWIELDEDLSLKGFLQYELKRITNVSKGLAA